MPLSFQTHKSNQDISDLINSLDIIDDELMLNKKSTDGGEYETWVFVLDDDTEVTKKVKVK